MYSAQPSFPPHFTPSPRNNRPEQKKHKPIMNSFSKIGMAASLMSLPLLGAGAVRYMDKAKQDAVKEAAKNKTVSQKIGEGISKISNFGTKLHGFNFALAPALTAITMPIAILKMTNGIRRDVSREAIKHMRGF